MCELVSHVFITLPIVRSKIYHSINSSSHRVRQSKDLFDLLNPILHGKRKLQQHPSLLRVVEPTRNSEAATTRHKSISAPVARHHRHTSSIEQSAGSRASRGRNSTRSHAGEDEALRSRSDGELGELGSHVLVGVQDVYLGQVRGVGAPMGLAGS
jgi:hypothetical protein